jgi:hypothetical protein
MFNGHRWFLDTRQIAPPEYYPDGGHRIEVYALRDDFNYNAPDNSGNTPAIPTTSRFQTYQDRILPLPGFPEPEDLDQGSAVVWRLRRRGRNLHSVPAVWPRRQHHRAGCAAGRAGDSVSSGRRPLAHCQDPLLGSYRQQGCLRQPLRAVGGRPARQPASKNRRLRAQPTVVSRRIARSRSRTPPEHNDDQARRTGLREIIRSDEFLDLRQTVLVGHRSHICVLGNRRGAYNLDVFRVASNGNSLTNLTNTPSNRRVTPWVGVESWRGT